MVPLRYVVGLDPGGVASFTGEQHRQEFPTMSHAHTRKNRNNSNTKKKKILATATSAQATRHATQTLYSSKHKRVHTVVYILGNGE